MRDRYFIPPVVPKSSSSAAGWNTGQWREWLGRLVGSAKGHLVALSRENEDPAARVHKARKALKRLRSGTRLLGGIVEKDCLKQNRRLFREAARLLAGSRDGTVRLRTFDLMMKSAPDGAPGESLARARELLAAEAAAGEQEAGKGAADALALLEQVSFPPDAWQKAGKSEIKQGLQRLLRRARSDYADLVEGRSEEFHELRKRVKDLYYAVQALPAAPKGSRQRALKSLRVLEESLGRQNDVFVLEEWFRHAGFGPEQCPQFWEAASRRDKKLRKIVIREGAALNELGKSQKFRKALAGAS